MSARAIACVVSILALTGSAFSQEPPPSAPTGTVAPHQKLPRH